MTSHKKSRPFLQHRPESSSQQLRPIYRSSLVSHRFSTETERTVITTLTSCSVLAPSGLNSDFSALSTCITGTHRCAVKRFCSSCPSPSPYFNLTRVWKVSENCSGYITVTARRRTFGNFPFIVTQCSSCCVYTSQLRHEHANANSTSTLV